MFDSGTLRDSKFVREMRCDEGEFPGLVSMVEDVSDEEMVLVLLSQAIRKSEKPRGIWLLVSRSLRRTFGCRTARPVFERQMLVPWLCRLGIELVIDSDWVATHTPAEGRAHPRGA